MEETMGLLRKIRNTKIRFWQVWAVSLIFYLGLFVVASYFFEWLVAHRPVDLGGFERAFFNQLYDFFHFVSYWTTSIIGSFFWAAVIATTLAGAYKVIVTYVPAHADLTGIFCLLLLVLVAVFGGFVWTSWAYTTDFPLIWDISCFGVLWIEYVAASFVSFCVLGVTGCLFQAVWNGP